MTSALSAEPEEWAFAVVVEMIQAARGRAVASVNAVMVSSTSSGRRSRSSPGQVA
jgi:hypothetical protein